MNISENKQNLKIIVSISNYLNVLIFDKSYNKKWELSPHHEITNILNEKENSLHATLCDQLKILNRTNKFVKSVQVLKEHQYKLMCISKLRSYIHTFNMNKICVIEEFSNNED